MNKKTITQLLRKVEKDYNIISKDFSKTRQAPWPEFNRFKPYLKPNINILDLGCGNGRLLTFLEPYIKKLKLKYLGIDLSNELIKEAKKQFPNQYFIQGSQLEIPQEKNSTDQIWSIAAFHHIPSKQLRLKSLQEMHRVLKPKGLLIITNWNLFQAKYKKHLYKAIWRSIKTLGNYEPTDLLIPWAKTGINRYYHAFTKRELKKLFKKAGFEIIEEFHTHNLCYICRKK